MRTLYLSGTMGVSGNMLLGALLDLLEDQEASLASLNALGHPRRFLSAARIKCPAGGNLVTVTVHGHDEERAP